MKERTPNKINLSKQDEDSLMKMKLLIPSVIHALLSNGVHIVKKFEILYQEMNLKKMIF